MDQIFLKQATIMGKDKLFTSDFKFTVALTLAIPHEAMPWRMIKPNYMLSIHREHDGKMIGDGVYTMSRKPYEKLPLFHDPIGRERQKHD